MIKNYFLIKYCWIFLLLLISSFAIGQIKTWNGSSNNNWSTPANWTPVGVPIGVNDVVIPNTSRQPTISSNDAVCNSLTINYGATLTVDKKSILVNGLTSVLGTLNFTSTNGNEIFIGLVTIDSNGVWNNVINEGITFRGGITNYGTFSAGNGIQLFDTNNQSLVGDIVIPNLQVNNINLINNDNLTVITALSGSGKLTNNINGVLNIGGSIAAATTLATSITENTVNYYGSNQTVKATTYYNLTLSGSGTKTFTGITATTNLLAIQTGVSANLGAFTHPAKILTLGGAGPLADTWGSTTSNPIAVNTNDTFFAQVTGKINVNGSAPGTAIDNNFASYSNGNTGQIAGSNGENDGPVTLSAPAGTAFINVKFASYGKPGGVIPNFTIGSCHAFNSRTVTTQLLGSNIATIPAAGSYNNTFGDPCYGVVKSYNVVATYAQPFCTSTSVPSFVINGSTPTGGNGAYTYLWEKSTTNATTGYTVASGINDEINYTVPNNTVNRTTWYRRTVTSGIYSDATIVIIQVVAGPPTVPTSFTNTTVACNGTITLTANGGSLGGLGGYAEFYTDGGAVVATSNVLPASVTVSPTTGRTTYYVRYRNSCSDTSSLSKVVTNTIAINATATTNPICYSTAAQNASLIYTATMGSPTKYSINWDTAATTAGLVNQIDTGFAFVAGGGTINTIAIPSSVPAGTYSGVLVVKNSVGCFSFKNVFSVTINPKPTAPFSTTIKHPDCLIKTGSVELTGLPTGSWTITTIPATANLLGTSGTNATTTVSGLNPNTNYTFTVSNGSCSSSPSVSVFIKALPLVATYNNGWTNGPPTIEQSIVFASNYSSSGNIVGCDCKVNTGKNVTINSGHTLTLTNGLNTVGASLTIENTGSLVQINDAALNYGKIKYVRVTNTGVRNTDFTYWSSPVAQSKLGGTGGMEYQPANLEGTYFDSFYVDAVNQYWQSESMSNEMIPARGYSIRGPGPINANPLSFLQVTFEGTPNNGAYSIPNIFEGKSYLVGNPYPSALDADQFLIDNRDVLDGTLYFWTHKTQVGIGVSKPGSGLYAYSGDDYATYNLTGGTATAKAAPSDPDKSLNNPFIPNGKIAAGQGFFANTKLSPESNIIKFTNSMRVGVKGNTGTNNQFFKTATTKSKKTTSIEKNRLWLNLYSDEGAFKQLLVGYITGATNEYDNGYDGETFDGNELADFYSINQETNFAIQGRALPFEASDIVPLGYRSKDKVTMSIDIDQVDGAIESQNIFIEDKMLNVVHDLKKGAYTFTTEAGVFNDRFVLRYTNKILGNVDFDLLNEQVIISKDKKELKIKSEIETIKRVTVFDLLGKKVLDKELLNETEFRSSTIGLSKQVGIVKVTLSSDKVITKKIAF
ncbi:T9SS sorting signal type C domain-containing protein [Flavobacterium sp. P4023]|uniref:T9SS sorting signal type C domain-containing protein n=1 Tax=Flavobacterium flabelliforme TaxID=2816119 RepID=A0ABS5CQW8_9FLAO|nr:T9SS sorting signal type C domain-containing protein [Flavobacterium flabelliforme]MBP4141015.1 T9SS sorting signal type C domain-containing protein [Flavobacterium flabelliforme]